ncbi:unnamed protein product [Symbiodinium sp. CCMP2456]|nr:unnamed protein product [Symbiodinium sp. CCMP2456]
MTWFASDVEERSAFKWQHLPLAMDAPPGLEAENPTATAALRAQSDVGASLASLAKSVNDSVVEMASDWHNVLSMLPYISNMTGPGEGLRLPEKTLTDPLQENKGASQSLAASAPEAACRQSMLAWLQADLGTESQGPTAADSAVQSGWSSATSATNPKDSGKKKKSKARLIACPWPLEEACCPWPMATRDKTGGTQAGATASGATGGVLRHVNNKCEVSAPVQQPAPASPAVSSARTPMMSVGCPVQRVASVPSVQESPVASRYRGPLMPGLVTDFLVSREGELSNKTIASEGSPQELNMSDSTPTMLSTQSRLSTLSKSTHSFCTGDQGDKEFLEPEEQPWQGNGSRKKQKKRNGAAFVCEYSLIPRQEILEAFEFVPKLYGRTGKNMKDIAASCGGKVRLRGRGSRYYELGGLEAPMNLKLYLSCASQKSFEVGHKMVLDLFRRLESEFLRFGSRDGKAIVSKYGAPRRSDGKSSLFTFSISRGVSRAACPSIGSRQSRSPWES